MASPSHPPAPGGFVLPNLTAIEDAVRSVTFPISKRDLLDQINEEETVIVDGRNVELRTLVRDLPDDFFESESEFHDRLQDALGYLADGSEIITIPAPPTGFPQAMPRGARDAIDQRSLPQDNA